MIKVITLIYIYINKSVTRGIAVPSDSSQPNRKALMTSINIYGCTAKPGTDGRYHYVYRITNLVENKHYYGSRTSKIIPNLDLGYIYYSSSSNVKFIEDQKINPEKYKYKIISTHANRHKAINCEIILHNKFKVSINEMFYNKCIQRATGFDTTGIKHTEETKIKISKSLSGEQASWERKKGPDSKLYGVARTYKNQNIKFFERCSQIG
jgi:hypothetical protein